MIFIRSGGRISTYILSAVVVRHCRIASCRSSGMVG